MCRNKEEKDPGTGVTLLREIDCTNQKMLHRDQVTCDQLDKGGGLKKREKTKRLPMSYSTEKPFKDPVEATL